MSSCSTSRKGCPRAISSLTSSTRRSVTYSSTTDSPNQIGPTFVSARELLVDQQHPTFGNAQTAELEPAYRATAQHGELRRRLAAGHHQTALMPRLAHCAQQCAVAGKAVSIAPLVLTWLEHRLKVVEHQQARPISQKLEQDGEPSRVVLRWHDAVGRKEPNRACQPLTGR